MKQQKTVINEGLLDFLKQSVGKAANVAAGAWEKMKGAMSAGVQKMRGVLVDRINKLKQLQSQLAFVKDIQAEAERESGEKLPIDQTMQIAMNLPKVAQAAAAEAQAYVADSEKVKKNPALAGVQQPAQAAPAPAAQPAPQAAPAATESINLETYNLIKELYQDFSVSEEKRLTQINEMKTRVLKEEALDEVLGVTTVLGLILAVIGGLPLALKGLMKLAQFMKANKIAEALNHAHHVAHHLEEKVVEYAIPDKLSYAIYKIMWNKGLKVTPQLMPEEGWKYADDPRKKVEQLMYKMVLAYFAINGLMGVLHAGASLLGVAEGTATAIKGVEIARGINQAAQLAAKV